jgi:ring-1,2-phenylacetyl-CoA epoxidase subunit PaaC
MKSTEHIDYLLRLADNTLILGQRLGEWCGHGPVLEEDIALANVALDLIGQARLLYTHAGALEGRGRDEDALAMRRDAGEFRNFTLLELPRGDYAHTTVRNFLFGAYQVPLWGHLAASADGQLAAIAAKAIKEARYHLEHARDWLVRLGDGTGESHARCQRALDLLWPYTTEMFAPDGVEDTLATAGIAVRSAELQPEWQRTVDAALSEATLARPETTRFMSTGKLGVHSEHLGFVLAEMQFLQRAYPDRQW